MQGGQASQTALQAAQAEALAAKRAAREHAAQVAALRSELDKLNRQLEQTCTLRLQPHDASDSQVTPRDYLAFILVPGLCEDASNLGTCRRLPHNTRV